MTRGLASSGGLTTTEQSINFLNLPSFVTSSSSVLQMVCRWDAKFTVICSFVLCGQGPIAETFILVQCASPGRGENR